MINLRGLAQSLFPLHHTRGSAFYLDRSPKTKKTHVCHSLTPPFLQYNPCQFTTHFFSSALLPFNIKSAKTAHLLISIKPKGYKLLTRHSFDLLPVTGLLSAWCSVTTMRQQRKAGCTRFVTYHPIWSITVCQTLTIQNQTFSTSDRRDLHMYFTFLSDFLCDFLTRVSVKCTLRTTCSKI